MTQWLTKSGKFLSLPRSLERSRSPEPHEIVLSLSQSGLSWLLLVAAGEPPVASRITDRLLLRVVALKDADVLSGFGVSSLVAQAEVGVVLAVLRASSVDSDLKKKLQTVLPQSRDLSIWFILTWLKTKMLSFKAYLLSCCENGYSLDFCESQKSH